MNQKNDFLRQTKNKLRDKYLLDVSDEVTFENEKSRIPFNIAKLHSKEHKFCSDSTSILESSAYKRSLSHTTACIWIKANRLAEYICLNTNTTPVLKGFCINNRWSANDSSRNHRIYFIYSTHNNYYFAVVCNIRFIAMTPP